ncbi:MAG: restriction endonuclease subunit S [Pyrinomonadaceae bacterium]
MLAKLADVAKIRTGVFARPERQGDVLYLQSKNFDELGELDSTVWPELKAQGTLQKHLLKRGDVLFAAKGDKNFGTVFQDDRNAVASPTFLVFEMKDTSVLSEYISWQLNDPTNLEFLRRNAVGTSMVSISKSLIGELSILIPPLEQQKKIVEAWRLSKKEYQLRLKIAELRESFVQGALARSINK